MNTPISDVEKSKNNDSPVSLETENIINNESPITLPRQLAIRDSYVSLTRPTIEQFNEIRPVFNEFMIEHSELLEKLYTYLCTPAIIDGKLSIYIGGHDCLDIKELLPKKTKCGKYNISLHYNQVEFAVSHLEKLKSKFKKELEIGCEIGSVKSIGK
jgi:hypothetical protein